MSEIHIVAQGLVANFQHISWEFCKGFHFLEKSLTSSLGHRLRKESIIFSDTVVILQLSLHQVYVTLVPMSGIHV